MTAWKNQRGDVPVGCLVGFAALVLIAISGVLIAALAAAFVVTVRTTPSSELRIDDARSTRASFMRVAVRSNSTENSPVLPENSRTSCWVVRLVASRRISMGSLGSSKGSHLS